jgi:hypothetical protein
VIRPEVTYGTYDTGGTDLAVRLSSDSPFSMIAVPQRYEIPSGDGSNRLVQNVTGRTVVKGTLNTPAYPSFATGGGTATWASIGYWIGLATTLTSNDLSSVSITYFDSVENVRVLGVKVDELAAGWTADSNEGVATFGLSLTGKQFATGTITQTYPAFANYPQVNPYLLRESTLTFGASRANWKAFAFKISNMNAATFEQGQYINNLTYSGRRITGSIDVPYLSSTIAQDRTAFEAQTAQQVTFSLAKSGFSTLALDFKSTNFTTSRNRTVPLGDISRQTFDFTCMYDPTANTDFSYTEG